MFEGKLKQTSDSNASAHFEIKTAEINLISSPNNQICNFKKIKFEQFGGKNANITTPRMVIFWSSLLVISGTLIITSRALTLYRLYHTDGGQDLRSLPVMTLSRHYVTWVSNCCSLVASADLISYNFDYSLHAFNI